MKIQNLIYGTAVVLFTINTASAMDCAKISCPSGFNKVRVYANECQCEQGMTPGDNTFTLMNNDDFKGGEYTGGVVIDDPEEPTEVCGTKEVNGDITSCCHMSSGSSPLINMDNAKDLLNSIQNTNRLDTVPSTSAIEALGNFTN